MKEKMMVVFAVITMFICSGTVSAAEAPWEFHEVQYICEEGDTLDKIADEYIEKNTYDEREKNEFIEGIVERNEALWYSSTLNEGQVLYITYWTKR